jgi:hypothetical protein
MGPVISVLMQVGLLAVVVVIALAAGYALARLAKSNVPVAAALAAAATIPLTLGLWFFVHGAFEKVETDQTAVATLVTSVVGVLWLAGLTTGYTLSRPRG